MTDNDTLAHNTALSNTRKQFTITDVPVILFEELSRHFGIGDEEKYETPLWVTTNQGDFSRIRDLNKDHPLVGFLGRLSLSGAGTQLYLKLFSRGRADNQQIWEDSSNPILEVQGGITNIYKSPWHRVNIRDIDFSSPAMKLVGMILIRAHQLATDPRCFDRPYWE